MINTTLCKNKVLQKVLHDAIEEPVFGSDKEPFSERIL